MFLGKDVHAFPAVSNPWGDGGERSYASEKTKAPVPYNWVRGFVVWHLNYREF